MHGPEGCAVLEGMTVWVVEPGSFAGYALQARLRDLDAKVVLVRDPHQARARLAFEAAPALAVIDCAEWRSTARELARDLRERDVKVVCTVDPLTDPLVDGVAVAPGTRSSRAGAADAVEHAEWMNEVAKPYAMIDVERAIAGHYGLVI